MFVSFRYRFKVYYPLSSAILNNPQPHPVLKSLYINRHGHNENMSQGTRYKRKDKGTTPVR